MGKGTITANLGQGKYQVKRIYNRDGYGSKKAALEQSLSWINEKIEKAPTEQKAAYELQKIGIEKHLSALENDVPDDPTITTYCAEYNEGLSGTFATADIPEQHPGEAHGAVILPRAWTPDDGQLVPTATLSAAQSFYFTAIMPGWEKWQPMYRKGEITAIDKQAGTCDVRLISAKSSKQSLNVNQGTSLSNVPIKYMTCDALAFEVEDLVLVKFQGQNFNAPKVIGFGGQPKPCTPKLVVMSWRMDEDGYKYIFVDLELGELFDIGLEQPIITSDIDTVIEQVMTANSMLVDSPGAAIWEMSSDRFQPWGGYDVEYNKTWSSADMLTMYTRRKVTMNYTADAPIIVGYPAMKYIYELTHSSIGDVNHVHYINNKADHFQYDSQDTHMARVFRLRDYTWTQGSGAPTYASSSVNKMYDTEGNVGATMVPNSAGSVADKKVIYGTWGSRGGAKTGVMFSSALLYRSGGDATEANYFFHLHYKVQPEDEILSVANQTPIGHAQIVEWFGLKESDVLNSINNVAPGSTAADDYPMRLRNLLL